LLKRVKQLIIKNYTKAKNNNDNKTIKLLKNILNKIKKMDAENITQEQVEILIKMESILSKRLEN